MAAKKGENKINTRKDKDKKVDPKFESKAELKSDKRLSNYFSAQEKDRRLSQVGSTKPTEEDMVNTSLMETNGLNSYSNSPPSDLLNIDRVTLNNCFDSQMEKIKGEMQLFTTTFKEEIKKVNIRITSIEEKLECSMLRNNLMEDKINSLEQKINNLEAKMVDWEDRSRRRNIRIRGIPESISNQMLIAYLTELLNFLDMQLQNIPIIFENVHRLPKARSLPAHIPREVIVSFHSPYLKTKFNQALRLKSLKDSKFEELKCFNDLSLATRTARKKFLTCTGKLRDHNISYTWLFPTGLKFYYKDNLEAFKEVDSLHQWLLTNKMI
ncbi:Hypothetical predicted protein [Pelobates cultripes]|uniref:Uncharacterized protein n=1 Tax=Pelobates cultripes TaxID=61616 RepID=A0AAD1R4M2_PELCU|nr:Hypothetical predicted protein [Pelobates cultripes]CAH2223355.1 Hypothetical predicted protein [Pelobates cultripes]CAH2306185.1 Hypothetical predicted protein [Pelobates cultripes]